MDDACFSFEADNPVSLVEKASALLQIVDETCEAHGLRFNMNDGKTEFSIEMKGGGARKQFRRLWREDKKSLCISPKKGKSATYKHVGAIQSRTQNPRDDAEANANNALTSYRQCAHSIFRNSRISLHLHQQLANSLCMSRLKVGVDTWLYTTRHSADSQVRVRICSGSCWEKKADSLVVTIRPMRWHWKNSNDLFLLKERLSPLAKLCKGSSKRWQALRRVAIGARETLLEDLRWLREVSTTQRRMPVPYHQPEPWMNLLDNEKEWSKAQRQLDGRCSRLKKPASAKYMSDEQLMTNPQTFVCMVCPGGKRRCCNSAGALVSHQHRSHWYHNPSIRAAVDNSCPACNKAFDTRAEAPDRIPYRAKWCRQSSLDGNISWALEEETALADERDRKEAAKLGIQGWAQLRSFGVSEASSVVHLSKCSSVDDDFVPFSWRTDGA